MVFESVVVELLNRFLGDYVENLDSTQLKLSIWGGDVVLKNLILKESALNDLDLPVRTVAGHLEKLVLKIPWTNLYNAPVVANIEGLFLLVVPKQSVKYDEEKEKKLEQESKQKELLRIEEAKKAAAEQGTLPKENDTFIEKLATQIIKNVQVTIENIHIRYEDFYTSPHNPFSLGISLHRLAVESTDENWKAGLSHEAEKMIYKMLSLDSLAVYWNSHSTLMFNLEPEARREALFQAIAQQGLQPDDFKYVMGPICSSAKLKLNPKPELDGSHFTIPKISLDVEMEELALGLSKSQYQDIMELLQSFEWMTRASPFRKFRPDSVAIRGNSKTWWHFAYACILSDSVKRKHNNWSWDHMKKHRVMCRAYQEAYYTKLTQTKVPKKIQAILDESERELDVFNITLIRKRVEVEVERLGSKPKEAEKGGWFSSWWGGGKKAEEDEGPAGGIVKQFEEALTPEEKQKMFVAIGYQENLVPAVYPTSFVENKFKFLLKRLCVRIADENLSHKEVMMIELKNVSSCVEQRPSAQALKVIVDMESFTVHGSLHGSKVPKLIRSLEGKEQKVLLNFLFETNPIDERCDQRIHFQTQPLEVVYHATTINQLIQVFQAPHSVELESLQAVAASTLANFKEMSASGLQYAIEQHKRMELRVDLNSSQVMVPYAGAYSSTTSVLVLNLGSIKMHSVDRDANMPSVRAMFASGTQEEDIMKEMMAQSYDKFTIELKDFQVILALPGEDWHAALHKQHTDLHLINPVNLVVGMEKCLVMDDPRLPRMKITGQLNQISLNISDKRVIELASLVSSIPFDNPGDDGALQTITEDEELKLKADDNAKHERTKIAALKQLNAAAPREIDEEEKAQLAQIIDLEFRFELGGIQLRVQQCKDEVAQPLLEFCVMSFGVHFVKKTYDMLAIVALGSISLRHFGDVETDILKTPAAAGTQHLFTLKYVNVDKKSPEFSTVYESIIQAVEVHFAKFAINLNENALLDVIKFQKDLMSKIEEMQNESTVRRKSKLESGVRRLSGSLMSLPGTTGHRKHKQLEVIDMKIKAHLQDLTLLISTAKRSIIDASIKGLQAAVEIQKRKTSVSAVLRDVIISDPDPDTSYNKILSTMDSEALVIDVSIYNGATEGKGLLDMNAVDMAVKLRLGGIKIVFLNRFVAEVMAFIDQFQAAKDALVAASAAAAEAARHNMEEVYSQASRMSLDIRLKAPIIVVPKNRHSHTAIVIDLGVLTLKNTFELQAATNELGMPAIFDKIRLDLQQLKLSRARLKMKTTEIMAECLVLDPASFGLDVVRNLSVGWYKEAPELDISGWLGPLQLSFSEEDYSTMMLTLNENIFDVPEDDKVVSDHKAMTVAITEVLPASRRMSCEGVDAELSLLGITHKKITFSFTFEELSITLYMGKANLKQKVGSVPRNEEKALGCLALRVISINGNMLSDNTIWARVVLLNCILDDLRKERKSGIKRYMEKQDQTESKGMIDVTYTKGVNEDMFIEVKVFGFDLVLCVPFMMQVLGIFTASEAPQGKDASPSSSISSQSKSVQVDPYYWDGVLTVNLKVEKPNIIIVEDVEDVDTSALVLQTEVTVKMRCNMYQQSLSANVRDLQIFTCCYNPVERDNTMAQILTPCQIFVVGNTPQGQGMHMDVSMTDIILHVSPGTIELLSTISSSFGAKTDDSELKETEEPDYSNLWAIEPLEENAYWFLTAEVGQDALTLKEVSPTPSLTGEKRHEQLVLSSSRIVMTVEAGSGNRTMPMILLECGIQAEVRDWSTQMCLMGELSLEIAYYNSKLALWEPLIEPIEVLSDGKYGRSPWQLSLEMITNSDKGMVIEETDSEELSMPPPKIALSITSQEMLDVTVTKTFLEVLTSLGEAFEDAVKHKATKRDAPAGPYVIQNDTGTAVVLQLKDSAFQQMQRSGQTTQEQVSGQEEVKEVVLEPGTQTPLVLKEGKVAQFCKKGKSLLEEQEDVEETHLTIRLPDLDYTRDIPVARADKRYFPLPKRTEKGDHYALVSDISVREGCEIITLRSIIKIFNHFQVSVDAYYMSKRGNEVVCIGTVEPEKHLNLPMHAIYTPTSELFFGVSGYTLSVSPVAWKSLLKDITTHSLLQCNSRSPDAGEPFYINTVGEVDQMFFENSQRRTMVSTCFNIHLRPTVVLKNQLPMPIYYSLQGRQDGTEVVGGSQVHVTNADIATSNLTLVIKSYLGKDWVCTQPLQVPLQELNIWTFEADTGSEKVYLDLGMHSMQFQGSHVISLYSPFWMVNKTGKTLTYRRFKKGAKNENGDVSQSWVCSFPLGSKHSEEAEDPSSVVTHKTDQSGPVLFSFRGKAFFGKKKAVIKIGDSEWSEKFSLDVAGSSGMVTCKTAGIQVQVAVEIKLSHISLTKMVIFTPRHILMNNSPYDIQVQEKGGNSSWTTIPSKDCASFWPINANNLELVATISGTTEQTTPFSLNKVHTSLLKLQNKYGGINVNCDLTEASVYVTLDTYRPGLAPARFMNHSLDLIEIQEKGTERVLKLEPQQVSLFAWENPTGQCFITWTCGKKSMLDTLCKDGIGEATDDGHSVFWVSFLDGMQRTLMFTKNFSLASAAENSGEWERIEQEVNISLQGVGLSLTNNITRTELLYMGITSSGIIWEAAKKAGKRFKALSIKDSVAIEMAYQIFLAEQRIGKQSQSPVLIEGKLEVDFALGTMLKPHKRRLRRSFETGLWLQYKTSPHQIQIHAKINRIQIDNQLSDCVFPVMLAPVPLPKSVAADCTHKPFTEVSIMQRITEHSTIQQFKYFKVLIQEFHVKIDQGIINGLLEMFAVEAKESNDERLFKKDVQIVESPLIDHVILQSAQEQKNFFDLLHFSPLKVHVSFSMGGGSGLKGSGAAHLHTNFLNLLLQSVGVTVTEIQDVVFRLAYFEREHQFITNQQLVQQATMHYTGQAIKQLYVLVLGLDVIGNPFSLVVGVAQGVEDFFYEPFQGAIQGPGEFAEGLALGMRSLLGHTVGGAAGAVSRITGTLGKGIAALSMDEDYQRKRRQALNQRPSHLGSGLAQSGKGLVMGVVDGVSGVVMKPISGAREEGVEGFFKGVGKGVMGLVTRPTAGVIDFASGSLDAVKRATEVGDETKRQRFPRLIQQDGLVRPYCTHDAAGWKILRDMEKGRYATTDQYVDHLMLSSDHKVSLLVTDKRVFYLERSDLFGQWQVQWRYTWLELAGPPTLTDKGLLFSAKEQKKVFGLFGSDAGKIVMVPNRAEAEVIQQKIESVMKASK